VTIDTCARYTSRHTVQKRNKSSWDRVPSSCRDVYDVQIAPLLSDASATSRRRFCQVSHCRIPRTGRVSCEWKSPIMDR